MLKDTNDSKFHLVTAGEEENWLHGLSYCEGCGSGLDTVFFIDHVRSTMVIKIMFIDVYSD